jgi:hypothetical protein
VIGLAVTANSFSVGVDVCCARTPATPDHARQHPACLKIREREKAVRARGAAAQRQAQCEPLQWIAANAPEEKLLKMKVC